MSKKFLYFAILCLLTVSILITGCRTSETPTATKIFKNISIQEAANLIEDNAGNPDFVILDVRTPSEFNEGHIRGAINIDFYEDNFQDELDGLNKTDTYFIYCRTSNRSGQTLDIMKTLGFVEVHNLSGAGMGDWIAAGLPYETGTGNE